MKKSIIIFLIFTIFFIFAPPFLVKYDKTQQITSVEASKKDGVNTEVTNNEIKENESKVSENKVDNEKDEDITTFSSNTCFKKTYYISGDRVNIYEDSTGKDKVIGYLKKNDVIVAYEEKNGYIYCENNVGNKGWVRKNKDNLTGSNYKATQYKVDINITTQKMNITKDNKNIKTILCSTGEVGNADTETPIGVFYVQEKGSYFYSSKYNQGAKYFIKFFSNYLIHSIPTDKNGNIIEEEKKKLGIPVSHGCIRVPMEDSKWIYDNIPKGSMVEIHY
ncbi:L,D-transpeptidase family protein [Clostridium omnivorum]|uniref:L,D-transpeptidase n=1 Tax=Clostridium omnivorum TaxID=1604902 RepID=A0ABQ5N636_9CLOT|nr:L,D-transpeptidase [Clostridium sp. E14]GLC30490.1 L,D-transpeptidase [Clostridium sp. E14]